MDNLNQAKKDKFLNNLETAKNLLTVAGDIATSVSPLKNISSAKGLILMQSTAGGIIVDTAKGDTWDEQVVGIVGDFIGYYVVFFIPYFGTGINSALTLSGNHLGSHLKNALKSIKLYDKENSYTYTYKKDFQAMVGGQLQKVPYAKVPINKNGEMITTPTHSPLYYVSNEAEYNKYEMIRKSVKEKEISELSFKEICDFFAVLNTPMSSEYNRALSYNIDKQEHIDDKQTLYEIFSAYANEKGMDAETLLSPFSEKLHSFIKEATSTIFSIKNIYVVSINSDGTSNISKINKALKKREENSEFMAESKEEILLIHPYSSAQPIAPYQPKNTNLTIVLARDTYLDCSNINPSGSSSESKLILSNYKFNPYGKNGSTDDKDVKFINPSTNKDTILYKDQTGDFLSLDRKYIYNSSNNVTLKSFDNLNFNLINFAKENGFSLRSDKSSSMFDIRLRLSDKEDSAPTNSNGNFNLTISNLIITDENQNSIYIKEIYLHNGEDKRVYKSYYLEKNDTSDNDEVEKDSYTAKFNINLIQDENQGVFKKTTKLILAARDLSKDYSTAEIHSMSNNGVVSLEAKQKQSGQATYELKTSLIDIANNITNVIIGAPSNKDRINIKNTIKLKAMYKPNKGDDNYKDINWSYKIIKKDEYSKEAKDNIVTNDIKLEDEKFKGKEINFIPQTDIKDKELLEKLKKDDSTLIFFAYLRAPRYTTRYGRAHGRVDFKVPMKLKYENSKLYIYEFGHTDKSLSFDAKLSDKFHKATKDEIDTADDKYYINSSLNISNISIFKDCDLKYPATDKDSSTTIPFEIYVANDKSKNGINLINNENKSKFISKFNEVKQRVGLEERESVVLEVREDSECFCNRRITVDELIKIGINKTKANEFVNYINATMEAYNINTCKRKLHFLAQIRHESSDFKFLRELASGSDYENRKDLGNTNEGDGKRFKGRGLIQITGRKNYKAYGDYKKIDFTEGNNNLKLENKNYAVDSAGWFWSKYLNVDLNTYADLDDLIYISYRINGGFNGFYDRKQKLISMANKIKCKNSSFNNLINNNYSIKHSKAWSIHNAIYRYIMDLKNAEMRDCCIRYLELTLNKKDDEKIKKRRERVNQILKGTK